MSRYIPIAAAAFAIVMAAGMTGAVAFATSGNAERPRAVEMEHDINLMGCPESVGTINKMMSRGFTLQDWGVISSACSKNLGEPL